jgi:hypothetical protein
MTETDPALLADLPDDARVLLASPPLDDTKLLELGVRWQGVAPAPAEVADALRLFVVTWDPLEWLAPRPGAIATANAWPLEIVVYVPVWSLADMARRQQTTMAAVLAELGGRAVATAAAHTDAVASGRYAGLVAQSKAADLLSGNPAPPPGGAVITAVSPDWEEIGLGAITDFVQQAFGPVDFDRSLVELTITAVPLPGCPACAGRRFKFPADLAESSERMCRDHRKEADAVIRRRMARAEASNRAGWRMMTDASARREFPHLPGGLATRIAGAKDDPVQRARLVAEAAAGFTAHPDDFASAMAENRDQADRFPRWPVTLIRDLGRAGHGAEAVALGEALAGVDPARRAQFSGEAAVALAEAGLADQARTKIAENAERWPDDVRAQILAADALTILGDTEAALARLDAALPLAGQAKDYKAITDVSKRMLRLTRPEAGRATVQRSQRSRPARSQRKGKR